MKNYLRKGFYFSIPVLVWFLFIFIIDPYEFIDISHVINDGVKIEVLNRHDESSPRGNMLWKIIHFGRKPVKNILIGDSQGKHMKESLIKEISGKDFYNFCVPGASYETIIKIFWFAAEKTKLESVYFQVGFMNYNAVRSYCLYHFAQDYIDKPYLYFTTKEIFFDSFFNLLYQTTKNPKIVENSYVHEEIEVLDKIASKRLELFFSDYIYPQDSYDELKRIADYCKENDIELKFIILPIYEGTHEYLDRHDLTDMEKKFKDDIKSLGYTYDFDVPGETTRNRKNFIDYFHPRDNIIDELTKEIWRQNNN